MTPRDEPERDAWLGEALRHAPDANASPPASVSEAILRQARHAVKSPAAPPRAHPLSRWWSWLGRPPVAAGFATVMVATVVGVMWWDRPLGDALPPPAPAAPAAPVPAAEPPSAALPAQAPSPARDEPPAVERADRAPPRAAAKSAAPPPQPSAPALRREQAPDAAVATAAPAPAPAASAAPAPVQESRARAAEDASASRSGLAQAPGRAFSKAAPAAGLATRQQAADNTTPLGEPADRWTWQRAGGPQPMTPALQRWLAQLSRAARWRPADAAPPPAAERDVLQLSRDGARHSTIQLGDDAVWITPADGAPLMAPLPAATAAALRASLTDATP